MSVPIKIDGGVFLNFEIDLKSACNIFVKESAKNDHSALDDNINIKNALNTILDKYSKVFKMDLIPVKGFFDSNTNSFYTTSNEVVKGLYHVFTSDRRNLDLIATNGEGIFYDVRDRGCVPGNNCLYYGEDAANVYKAMEFIRSYFDEFIQENNKSVGQRR